MKHVVGILVLVVGGWIVSAIWNFVVAPTFEGVHEIDWRQGLAIELFVAVAYAAALWLAREYVREIMAAERAAENLRRLDEKEKS